MLDANVSHQLQHALCSYLALSKVANTHPLATYVSDHPYDANLHSLNGLIDASKIWA